MTRETVMDKDRLAAFVDGELSPEEAAAVVVHLADHPEDQAYVDDLMAANAALAQAFAAPLEEPVPPALRAAVMGREPAVVIPFRRRIAPFAGGAALAAGIAAAALLLWPGEGARMQPGAVAPRTALSAALDTLPSGVPHEIGEGRDLMILATLPVDDGFCREVEVIDRRAAVLEMAVACTDADGWEVQVVLSEPLPPVAADGFVPAGGAGSMGLTPFLDRLGAGVALSPQDEAAAIAGGWRP